MQRKSIMEEFKEIAAQSEKNARKLRRGRPSIYGLDRLEIGAELSFPISWAKEVKNSADAQTRNNLKKFEIKMDEEKIYVKRLDDGGEARETWHEEKKKEYPRRRELEYPWDTFHVGECQVIPLHYKARRLSLLRSLNGFKRKAGWEFEWKETADPSNDAKRILWVTRVS